MSNSKVSREIVTVIIPKDDATQLLLEAAVFEAGAAMPKAGELWAIRNLDNGDIEVRFERTQ